MTDIAKYLAHGLSVRYDSLAFSVQRGTSTKWSVLLDTGETIAADAVHHDMSDPAVLFAHDHDRPRHSRGTDLPRLRPNDLSARRGRPATRPRASRRTPAAVSVRVVRGRQPHQGCVDAPALTMHADAEWSLTHWDSSAEELTSLLRELAAPLLGQARILESNVKKWRFATPRTIWPERCLALDGIVFAGDAFGGPRVEGAVLSGLAAAQAVSESLS